MTIVTADEALERLKQGNERFRTGLAENPGRDIARRLKLAEGQNPSAIILCCSDSRVAPEFAFDAGLGDLFVVRVAGNVANTSSIGSIEYAVMNLIRPALESSNTLDADVLATSHARLTAQELCVESEIIRNAVDNDGVKIVPAFHQLATGAVVFD